MNHYILLMVGWVLFGMFVQLIFHGKYFSEAYKKVVKAGAEHSGKTIQEHEIELKPSLLLMIGIAIFWPILVIVMIGLFFANKEL